MELAQRLRVEGHASRGERVKGAKLRSHLRQRTVLRLHRRIVEPHQVLQLIRDPETEEPIAAAEAVHTDCPGELGKQVEACDFVARVVLKYNL